MKKTKVCTLLGIQYPVIQAPMNWITNAEMVAAVSNAGGMGVLGPNAGAKTPTKDVIETGERLRREINKVRTLTSKPFAVNIILPLRAYPEVGREFSDQSVKVAIEEKVPVVVMVGDGVEVYLDQFKKAGIKVLHRGIPINTKAAKRSEELGVDCIVAVGFEGGGHSGTDKLPTFVLVPQIVDTVKIPVVAGGGIMDGRGMAAALALGADGIFMGTRFMATTECPLHPNIKKAILEATDTSTVTVTGMFGIARCLRNSLMDKCMEIEAKGGSPRDVTRAYMGTPAGIIEGDLQGAGHGCGANVGIIHEIKSSADVVHDVVEEADRIISNLK